VSRIARGLGDPAMEKYSPQYLIDVLRLAQVQVCLRFRVLHSFNEDLTTTASTRSYNIVSDWNIDDFLAIDHIWVDGEEKYPLDNGMAGLDLKSNPESNWVDGYILQGDLIYFEPIPSTELTVYLDYIRRPAALNTSTMVSLEANSTLELGPEYVPAIEAMALAMCYPAGSAEWERATMGFEKIAEDLQFALALRNG
jgi:hypothetical protein